MLRREAQRARSEGRNARTLLPSDFLLGVSDKNRMGWVRFKVDEFLRTMIILMLLWHMLKNSPISIIPF